MIKRMMLTQLLLSAVTLLAMIASTPARAAAQAEPVVGEQVYQHYCSSCHGARGDGRGPAAARLAGPPPRDFTTGVYRHRTTETGSLATTSDLVSIVRRGVPGTTMPSWAGILDEGRIAAVVAYIQSLSPRYREMGDEPPNRLYISSHFPPSTPQAIQRGRQVFLLMKCWSCHGTSGAGDGPEVPRLADDHARPVTPADLRSHVRRWGGDEWNTYRTLATGLDGTPMAAVFADPMLMLRPMVILRAPVEREVLALTELSEAERVAFRAYVRGLPDTDALDDMSEEEEEALLEQWRWDLVHYARSLRGESSIWRRLLGLDPPSPLYGRNK